MVLLMASRAALPCLNPQRRDPLGYVRQQMEKYKGTKIEGSAVMILRILSKI